MRRLLSSLTIIGVLLGGGAAYAQNLIFDTFGDYLESLRVQAGIPGLSAAVVGESAILWDGAFGQSDVQRSLDTTADTAFHLDGTTQVVTTSLVLRCVEDGRLSLDDTIGLFAPEGPDAGATIGELMTHTTVGPGGLAFAYRPDRLAPLAAPLRACAEGTFQEIFGLWLDQLGMTDSVPGPDAVGLVPTPTFSPPVGRYLDVLARLTVPYDVDDERRSIESAYSVSTLTPAAGLISTVRDFARFDLALKNGLVLRSETRTLAWNTGDGQNGEPLPHGLGWFVETYDSELVVWQFGVGQGASSSLVVTVPERDLTLILMANSDGLAAPFDEATPALTVSPFARLFLEVFAR